MKRLISIFFCIVCAFAAQAGQLDVNRLAEAVSGKRVSFNLSFSEQGKKGSYRGNALIQKECYNISVNGTSFICDGKTLWIVDEDGMEVTIQDAEPLPGGISNPKQLLKRITVKESGEDSLSGIFSVSEEKKNFDFRMSSVKIEAPSADKSDFSYDISPLDKSWIVTDLR